MRINVTVCELRDHPDDFAQDWERLVAHVRATASDLVVLPEVPFYRWFATTRSFDPGIWREAVEAHERWLQRLDALAPALVLGTRPVNTGARRLNEGFVWDAAGGYRGVHAKYYLPDEEGFWEASWYDRGAGDFTPIASGALGIGFLICTELWFFERARAYGKAGAHLIVTPRATGQATVEKWLVGGRAAAVVSGAFSLSSNRVDLRSDGSGFGGQGWVVGPDGQVLGLTSPQQPFVTVPIDLQEAERARHTYPRSVLE
jgi:N-carbamoylputrescine amidase